MGLSTDAPRGHRTWASSITLRKTVCLISKQNLGKSVGRTHHVLSDRVNGLLLVAAGYFQVYYTDTKELLPGNKIDNITLPGSGGNPDQGVAVARAKIADVVAAAKKHTVVPFHKYFDGKWEGEGLAKGYNESAGDFTPLNLPVQHFMHGDAAYIPSIRQWAIVTPSGGFVRRHYYSLSAVLYRLFR